MSQGAWEGQDEMQVVDGITEGLAKEKTGQDLATNKQQIGRARKQEWQGERSSGAGHGGLQAMGNGGVRKIAGERRKKNRTQMADQRCRRSRHGAEEMQRPK